MKKETYGLIGILVIILIITAISGCTSSEKTDPKTDIYLQQTTPADTMLNQQNGWITSKSGKSYSNITFIATGYTSDNQVIGTDKIFVTEMSNQYQSTGFTAKFTENGTLELDHITIQVINATPN